MYRFIPSKRNSRRKSSTTCRRGGNVGAEISIGPGASRSFSLSHPGPRTTHASAPDAPPLPSPLAPPAQPPQFPSHPRRLFSLSVFVSRSLAHQPSFLASFLASSSHFRCRWLSSRFRRIDEDTTLLCISVLSIFAPCTRIPHVYVCVCLPLSLSLSTHAAIRSILFYRIPLYYHGRGCD